MHKALALYSGGLDSLLSILIVKEQNIDVVALKFLTGFTSSLREDDLNYSKQFGFPIIEVDVREKFITLLKEPEHGFGKNLNPCIDCKILMLKEAKKLLPTYNAQFIITGEVVSQRPMTQQKSMLFHIDKKTELSCLILRPLSAKLLPPTIPEKEGIVNRELLYDIWGRTRKPQLALTKKYGIEKIPQPAGGCLLTDPTFCKKLKDLIEHDELNVENIELLKVGRHFRLSQKCKAIVGRCEEENEVLLKQNKGIIIHLEDFKGPVVLLSETCSDDEIDKGASICVYYSKKEMNSIVIKVGDQVIQKNYGAMLKDEVVKYRII